MWLLLIFLGLLAQGHSSEECPSDDARKNDGLSIACSIKLDALTDSVTQFSRCVARSAWPLRSCTKCFHLRKQIEDSYDALMKENATRSECAHELQDWNMVAPVALSYSYYTSLVERARCDLCLTRSAAGEYSVKPAVLRVFDAYDETVKCFKVDFPAHQRDTNSSAVVCDFCRRTWRDFSGRMKDLIVRPDDWQSCRDVMDMANRTWALWTEHDCQLQALGWWVQASNLLVIALLVVAYYGGVTFCYRGSKEERERAQLRRRSKAPQHLYNVDTFGTMARSRQYRSFTR